MLGWFLNRFRNVRRNEAVDAIQAVSYLNAAAGGGLPVVETQILGKLSIPSRKIWLNDPLPYTDIEIPEFAATQVIVSIDLLRYPAGSCMATRLTLQSDSTLPEGENRNFGDLVINTAKVVVADHRDFKEHFELDGLERTGYVSIVEGDSLMRKIKKRFRVQFDEIDLTRARIAGIVSRELENEITAYLESIPRYAQFPFMHFSVMTNGTFDRVNRMDQDFAFLPIGAPDSPVMFACSTGWGDGSYPVNGFVAEEKLTKLEITFLDEDEISAETCKKTHKN